MGVASLILGIISLNVGFVPLCGIIALIPAIIGLILGIIDIIKKNKTKEKKNQSIAGIILSAIAIVFIIFLIISFKIYILSQISVQFYYQCSNFHYDIYFFLFNFIIDKSFSFILLLLRFRKVNDLLLFVPLFTTS